MSFKIRTLTATLYLFLVPALSIAAEGLECKTPYGKNLHKAPIPFHDIKPEFPREMGPDISDGCAVIKFDLKEAPLSKGKVLVPKNIDVVTASDTPFATAAKEHVSKFLYLASSIDINKKYAHVVNFSRKQTVETAQLQ
jgi:hypothetical protein